MMDHDSLSASQPSPVEQPVAPVLATNFNGLYTPIGHQLPEHGTPDSVPAQPNSNTVMPQSTTTQPTPPVQPVAFEPASQVNSFMPKSNSSFFSSTPETPKMPSLSQEANYSDRPVPVVRVLSVRGVEYAMMSIMLWIWAGSLITILVTLIMGGSGFSQLAFPISLLVIAVPVFALFYIRLRRAELRDPSLRLDASKRRFSQITQIVAFLACFFNLVTFVYMLMSAIGGTSSGSIGKYIGSTVVVLLVAGSILAYYWFDEHKLVK